MPPLVEAFDSSELAERVNHLPSGKTRKPPIADLKKCALKEMFQYHCELNGPVGDPTSRVLCKPVLRLFRKCANGLTVETTGWEGRYDE